MNSIITYLIMYNQYLLRQISILLLFIAKHIPLKQWAFDDSNSPKYQKFKVDKLPKIFIAEPIDYQLLLAYYQHKYGITVKPIKHRSQNIIPETVVCPRCGAPLSIYTEIMVPRDNTSVKSATNVSTKPASIIVHWLCVVLIAVIYSLLRKTVSIFAFTNV